MDKRTWIIFIVAVVAILAGLVLVSRQESVDVSGIDHTQIQTASDTAPIGDHVYGNEDSEVVVIEYGDFQCPGCGNFHTNFEPLMEDYKEDIAFVFRNFPLTSIHPNARAAAAVVEAAGLQDKYWEMWNLVFENQNAWSNLSANERDARFRSYAQELKLDLTKYDEAVKSEKVSQKINFDQSLGKDNGVTGTPSLFVNGKEIPTEEYNSTDAIRATLDKALKDAGVEKSSDKEKSE